MGAKAIDYSVYNEEALFMELNSTKEQIAELESKKSQIEQALKEKPNDETIRAIQESMSDGQGELVDASDFSVFKFHQQMMKELENENKAWKFLQKRL